MRLFAIVIAVIFMCIVVAFSSQPVNAQDVSQASVVNNASSKLVESLLDKLEHQV